MKVLFVLAAIVALSAARPSYLGLGLGGLGISPYLGIPAAPISVAIAPALPAPVPVTDTPEVVAAKAEHLAAVAKAATAPAVPEVPEVPAVPAPVPVQDTPEVAAAKAEHLAAVAKAAAAPAVPEVPVVNSGLIYTGVHGLGLPAALGLAAHAPIASLGWPAVGW